MSENEKNLDEKLLNQNVDNDELKAVSGGGSCFTKDARCRNTFDSDSPCAATDYCSSSNEIYKPGDPEIHVDPYNV